MPQDAIHDFSIPAFRIKHDVLPGRYSFGVTGRDPTGAVLPSGEYQLRLLAFATDAGPPTARTVGFTIK